MKHIDNKGRQLVQVQFDPAGEVYAYAWAGQGLLAVGDRVIARFPRWAPNPTATVILPPRQVATVCGLGAHHGSNGVIRRRAEP